MVTIKHKVTIKTKIAQEETLAAVDSLATKENTLEREHVSESSPVKPKSERKSKTGGIVGGIVAAVVLFFGIYFFGIRNNGGEANSEATQKQVSQAEKTNEIDALGEMNSDSESATPLAETAKPSEADGAPAAQPAKPSHSEQTSAAQQGAPTAMDDDVEENARRVIRGDFGNGQIRKDKLGASYSEIQGKVNEMYRQGLVH